MLRGILFPVARMELPRRAGADVPAQQEAILALDRDQENLARSMGPGRTLIVGPSGSGKTLILAHQAWNLPRVDGRVRRILVTCFNLSLVGYIRRLLFRKGVGIGPDGVEVIPFYDLCTRILGESLPHAGEEHDYYRLAVEMALERLREDHPLRGRWDAILADEGQDFSPEMAGVLTALLPEHGVLTVAQDDNQRIYGYAAAGWEGMGIPGLRVRRLSRQYRCTRAIARAAAAVLPEEAERTAEFAGADGPDPRWLAAGTGQELVGAVADAVAGLVRAGTAMSEIAVLYDHRNAPDLQDVPEALVAAMEARGVAARWVTRDTRSKTAFDVTTDSVAVSTIHSAKGLDFAHVVLMGLDGIRPDDARRRRLAHVGMTRARETLILAVRGFSGLAGELREALRAGGAEKARP